MGRCLRRRMQGGCRAASGRGFGAFEFSDRLLADGFAAGEECRAVREGLGTVLPAEMGRMPSSLQILFRVGRPRIEPPADEIRSVGTLFRMLLLFL